MSRGYAFGNFDAGTKDAATSSIIRALLHPIDLVTLGVERDPDAPPGRIRTIPVRLARVHEGFDVRAVETGAYDAYTFTIRPVQLAIPLIEMQLLGREGCPCGTMVL